MAQDPQNPKKSRKLRDPDRIRLDRAGKPRNPDLHVNGPKPKFTPEQFIEAYLRQGMSITKACKELGCSRELHYGWLAANPAYVDLFERTRAIFLEKAEEIAQDVQDSYVSIADLIVEMNSNDLLAFKPDDTPELSLSKRKHRQNLISEQIAINAEAISMAKHIHKLRGHKAGWSDKSSVEITGSLSVSDLLRESKANRLKGSDGQ